MITQSLHVFSQFRNSFISKIQGPPVAFLPRGISARELIQVPVLELVSCVALDGLSSMGIYSDVTRLAGSLVVGIFSSCHFSFKWFMQHLLTPSFHRDFPSFMTGGHF